MNNILLVSAHPDDMEIGMGGTAAKLAENGARLWSLVLTDGRRGPNPNQLSEDALAAQRKEEATHAAKILGIHDVIFCELQDLKSEDNYKLAVQNIRKQIEHDTVFEIFTLHPQLDRHETHRLAGKAVLDSFGPNEANISIWAYEVWGLFPEWDRFEDISSTIEKKLQAIGQHRSQIASIPFGDGVAGLNRWRGVFADPDRKDAKCAFAEVFVHLR